MVVASVVGWGLVINTFSDDASWNNWQGYLLGPFGLGGRDGAWAFANLGVLFALLIGLVGGYLLRRSTVRRQEVGNTLGRAGVGPVVNIEIWSDVVCPWCYIGKRRIEKALTGFEPRRRGGGALALLPARPRRPDRADEKTA